MNTARVSIAVALVCACGGGSPERPAMARGAGGPAASTGDRSPSSERADGPALTEIEARLLLTERFRRAGLRVLHDVPVSHVDSQLTVDGYDPDRRIGFEYIADDERGLDLADDERARLTAAADSSAPAILIVDAASAERVAELADAFLGQLSRDVAPTAEER